MLYPSDMANNVELVAHKPLVKQDIFSHLDALSETWNHLSVVDEVDSTNAFIQRNLSRVVPGNPYAITADEQTLGIGRLDRQWFSPFGAGIALSIGIAQDDVAHDTTAVPLIAGVAAVTALHQFGIDCSLKWPNDIVFIDSQGLRKTGGILVQRFQDVFAIGIGINVGLTEDEVPVPQATSLCIEGYEISREEIIAHVIHQLHQMLTTPVDWHSQYVDFCSTLGRVVRVTQTDKVCFSGTALRVDPDGALVIQTNSGEHRVTIGDVEHATID